MRDWDLAGLSFGKWCVLLFWLISGGLITGLFVYSCVDSLESIGESTKSSPAYWKAVVAVIVCVLILVGVTVLLIKEGSGGMRDFRCFICCRQRHCRL